jgi:hypothetical protein
MPRRHEYKLSPTDADALDLMAATLPEGKLARLKERLAAERELTRALAAAFNTHIDYANATRQRKRDEPQAERDAKILAMRDRGLKPGQIAKILGMTRGAVKAVIRRKK